MKYIISAKENVLAVT